MYCYICLFLWFAFDYSATFIFPISSELAYDCIETQAQLQVHCYFIVFSYHFSCSFLKLQLVCACHFMQIEYSQTKRWQCLGLLKYETGLQNSAQCTILQQWHFQSATPWNSSAILFSRFSTMKQHTMHYTQSFVLHRYLYPQDMHKKLDCDSKFPWLQC